MRVSIPEKMSFELYKIVDAMRKSIETGLNIIHAKQFSRVVHYM